MTENAALPWYRQLHWQVLAAMAVGIVTGLVGGEAAASWVGWLGTLFMRLLRMIIVPLIITSIVSGVASVGGGRALGRLFSKTLGYYVLSSTLAIFVGLLMVNLIRPGEGADLGAAQGQAIPELATPTSPIDLLLNIVPENFFAAASGGDMLAIIFFAIVLGIAIGSLPSKPGAVMTDLFAAAFETMMALTTGVIRFLPLGVFGLMTAAIGVRSRVVQASGDVLDHDRRWPVGAPPDHASLAAPRARAHPSCDPFPQYGGSPRGRLLHELLGGDSASLARSGRAQGGGLQSDRILRPAHGGDGQHGRHRSL